MSSVAFYPPLLLLFATIPLHTWARLFDIAGQPREHRKVWLATTHRTQGKCMSREEPPDLRPPTVLVERDGHPSDRACTMAARIGVQAAVAEEHSGRRERGIGARKRAQRA